VTKETISELRALAVQQQPEKKTAASKSQGLKKSNNKRTVTSKPSTTATTTNSNKKTTTITRNTTTKQTKTTTKTPKEKEATAKNENIVCIFCDEVNPEFNEDTLIKHYYNTCPVLTNCPMCKIVSSPLHSYTLFHTLTIPN
jgi:centrosomal protein CEP104